MQWPPSWVEEAKKEIQRVADEAWLGLNRVWRWVEKVKEEEFHCQTIQGITKAIPTYMQDLANKWRKDTDKEERHTMSP